VVLKKQPPLILIHKRLLLTSIALFFIGICGLLYQAYLLEKQQVLEANNLQFASRLMHLNAVIEQTEEDVQRMHRWAERYLSVSAANPSLTPLAARITDSEEHQYFTLGEVMPPLNQEYFGNILGMESFHNRSPRFYRLVNMSSDLFAIQHATHQQTPRILASEFFSPEYQFGSIFPYVSITEYLEFSEDGTVLGLYNRILSDYKKNNFPEDSTTSAGLWSEPLISLKRHGIKVHYLTGLYDREGFAGIITAEVGLKFLNRFMRPFKFGGGGLVLATYKDTVLATSKSAFPDKDKFAPYLGELFSDSLVAELRKIYDPEQVEAHKLLSYHVLVAPIADTRWTLMHILSEQELSTYLRPYQIGYGLVLVGTLIILCIGYAFINREFIQPALQARLELECSRESFRNIVDKNNNGILILDEQGNMLFSNKAARELLGLNEESASVQHLELPLSKDKISEFEINLSTEGKRILEVSTTDTQWQGYHAILAMLKDITKRKKAEAMAYHDPLTGIPNRLLFRDRLAHGLAISSRRGLLLALLYMDMDIFKEINDRLGHEAGDELLKMIAQRLTERVRESDTVARLGGDEFTIIMEGISDKQVPKQLAQSIVTAIAEPFPIKDEMISITVSIGISIFPDDGDNPEELIKKADAAMYAVKHQGGNGVQFYQRKDREEASIT
jgi:diguanylate cyclase (GGDEF)-like protein